MKTQKKANKSNKIMCVLILNHNFTITDNNSQIKNVRNIKVKEIKNKKNYYWLITNKTFFTFKTSKWPSNTPCTLIN